MSAIACAVTAPRARASRREMLLEAASRSVFAAFSKSDALRVIAATRSSSVRSLSRASTSSALDVATRDLKIQASKYQVLSLLHYY